MDSRAIFMDSRARGLPPCGALWRPVAGCGAGALPLKKDCSDPRLQYSRLGVLEAWSLGDCTDPMLQYSRLGVLEAWSLGGLEAWVGLQ